MSAPSLMCRTSLFILMMAVGLAAYGADAPATVAHKHAARRRHVAAAPAHTAHRATAHTAARSETARAHSRVARTHSHVPLRRRTEREVRHSEEARRWRETSAREIRAREIRASEIRNVGVRTTTERAVSDRIITDRATTDRPIADQPSTDRRATERPEIKMKQSDALDNGAVGRAQADVPETGVSAPKTDMEADSGPEATEQADDADVHTPPAVDLPEPSSLHLSRGGMPAPMRGSLALLERQDARLQADGLERIEDENDLAARIAHHLLVPLPASAALTVNPELPTDHRYCRPWTARFVADIARLHEAAFHKPLEVNSAVRTVAYQQHLMRINGNAAPAEGDIWSPHLMGATIDIGKKGMSWPEIAWMRRRLTDLEAEGKIDVEEEFQQACFHITVYKSYVPTRRVRPPREVPAQTESTEASAATGQ